MENEFNRYTDAANKVMKKLNAVEKLQRTELLRGLTYEQKIGLWLHNFITQEVHRASMTRIVEDPDTTIQKLKSILEIYKKIAKMHTTVPICTPTFYIGNKDEDEKCTITQMCIMNEATYHRMANYKGEIFIYHIETNLTPIEGKEHSEGRCMFRYVGLPTDKKNVNEYVNMSGE